MCWSRFSLEKSYLQTEEHIKIEIQYDNHGLLLTHIYCLWFAMLIKLRQHIWKMCLVLSESLMSSLPTLQHIWGRSLTDISEPFDFKIFNLMIFFITILNFLIVSTRYEVTWLVLDPPLGFQMELKSNISFICLLRQKKNLGLTTGPQLLVGESSFSWSGVSSCWQLRRLTSGSSLRRSGIVFLLRQKFIGHLALWDSKLEVASKLTKLTYFVKTIHGQEGPSAPEVFRHCEEWHCFQAESAQQERDQTPSDPWHELQKWLNVEQCHPVSTRASRFACTAMLVFHDLST